MGEGDTGIALLSLQSSAARDTGGGGVQGQGEWVSRGRQASCRAQAREPDGRHRLISITSSSLGHSEVPREGLPPSLTEEQDRGPPQWVTHHRYNFCPKHKAGPADASVRYHWDLDPFYWRRTKQLL